jgi:hypothetical protein
MRTLARAVVVASLACLGAALASCGGADREDEELNAVPTRVEPAGGTFSYVPWVAVVKESDEEGTGALSLRPPGQAEFSSSWLFGPSCPAPEYLSLPRSEKGVSSVACLEIEKSGDLEYYLSKFLGPRSEMRRETFVIELVKTAADGGAKAGALEFREIQTTCRLEEALTESADGGESVPKLIVSIELEAAKAQQEARRGTLEFSTTRLGNGAKTRLTYAHPEAQGVAGWRVARAEGAGWSPPFDYTTKAVSDTCGDDWICKPTPHDGVCVVEVKKMNPGKVAKGVFRCGALVPVPAEGAVKPFGEGFYLSGAWQCDRWR